MESRDRYGYGYGKVRYVVVSYTLTLTHIFKVKGVYDDNILIYLLSYC